MTYGGWAGRGVPGVWEDGRVREGYTGYYPVTLQDPYFIIFKPQGPTYGQMKGNIMYLMRFPRMGLEWGPERVQK